MPSPIASIAKGNGLRVWCNRTGNVDIVEDWCTEDNMEIGLDIDTVTFASSKKAFFKCRYCGEISFSTIKDRTLKLSKCGKCGQGRQTSYPEQLIFRYIRFCVGKDDIIHRGKAFGKYELDMTIISKKACIEYNGDRAHYFKKESDRAKAELCKANNVNLITIKDDALIDDIIFDVENNTFHYKENTRDKSIIMFKICDTIISSIGINKRPNKEEEAIIKKEALDYSRGKVETENSFGYKHPENMIEVFTNYSLKTVIKHSNQVKQKITKKPKNNLTKHQPSNCHTNKTESAILNQIKHYIG